METRFLSRASLRALKPLPLRHLRHQHTSSSPRPSLQAHPIGDYYASLLQSSTPPIASKPPSTTSSFPSATSASSDSEQVEDQGPAILFSSRLSSPLERRNQIKKTSTLIAGVWVPARPDEPDNCCMSGCVNCVWDRYRDELEEWASARREANAALKKEKSYQRERKRRLGGTEGTGLMLGEGEKGAAHTAVSMDDDGGGSEANWGTGLDGDFVTSSEELFKGVPVGIREFMKQEKRLKEKHAREGTTG